MEDVEEVVKDEFLKLKNEDGFITYMDIQKANFTDEKLQILDDLSLLNLNEYINWLNTVV